MYIIINKTDSVGISFAECLSGILQLFELNDKCITNISNIKALNNIQQYRYPHIAYVPGQTYIFYIKDDIHSIVKILDNEHLRSRDIDEFLKNLLYKKEYTEILKLLNEFKSKYIEEDYDIYFSTSVYLDVIILRVGIKYDY